jgi:large subunit ribosomal protein L10
MPTDAKRQAVTDLAELLRGSSALAVADYRGLTVSEMHTVRRSLRANGVSLKVAKNRLLKIAADEAGLAELKPMLDGPTAIASTTGDEVSLARALQDAFRPFKVVTLRGGLLGGQAVGAADLQRLATLPSREVLLSRLAGGMAAPLSGMAGVLAANIRNLVGVLSAVADQKAQSEGAASQSAPAVQTQDAPAEAVAAPEDASAEEPGTAEAPPADGEPADGEPADNAPPTESASPTDASAAADDSGTEEASDAADTAESADTAEVAAEAAMPDEGEAIDNTDTPTTD